MLTPEEIQAMKERDNNLDILIICGHINQLKEDRHKLLLDREELQAEVERLRPLPPVDPHCYWTNPKHHS